MAGNEPSAQSAPGSTLRRGPVSKEPERHRPLCGYGPSHRGAPLQFETAAASASGRADQGEDEVSGLHQLLRLPREHLPRLVDLGDEPPDPFVAFVYGRVQHSIRHVKAEGGIAYG